MAEKIRLLLLIFFFHFFWGGFGFLGVGLGPPSEVSGVFCYGEPGLYESNEQLVLGWERGLQSIFRGESRW